MLQPMKQRMHFLVPRRQWFFFHDESTLQSNEDKPILWAEKGTSVMNPKSAGSGIMVSDFIDEHNRFLQLMDEEYARAKEKDPTVRKYACQLLEY